MADSGVIAAGFRAVSRTGAALKSLATTATQADTVAVAKFQIPPGVDVVQSREDQLLVAIGPGGMLFLDQAKNGVYEGIEMVAPGNPAMGYSASKQIGTTPAGTMFQNALYVARWINQIGSVPPLDEAGLGMATVSSLEDLVKPDPFKNIVFALYQKNFLDENEYRAKEAELRAAVTELYLQKHPEKRTGGPVDPAAAALQEKISQARAGMGLSMGVVAAGIGGVAVLGLLAVLIKRKKGKKSSSSSHSNVVPLRRVAGLGGRGLRRR